MKLKEKITTYTLLVIMCVGIIVGSFFGEVGNIISTIVTSLTAIISAVAVYIQMKKDADITQTEFLLEFSKFFYTFEGTQIIEQKIDRAMEKNQIYEYTDDDYLYLCDYLLWLEGLASMVMDKSLTISLINDLYNYRFFAVVNNPMIQEKELVKFSSYYPGIFKLHKKWVDYRKAKGQPIMQEEFDLSKIENYESKCRGNT